MFIRTRNKKVPITALSGVRFELQEGTRALLIAVLHRLRRELVMHGGEYQDLVTKTETPITPKVERRLSDNARLIGGVSGVCTQSGKVVDNVHRHLFFQQPLDSGNLILQLGELMFNCAVIADAIGTDLDTVMRASLSELRKKYPDAFVGLEDAMRDIQANGQDGKKRTEEGDDDGEEEAPLAPEDIEEEEDIEDDLDAEDEDDEEEDDMDDEAEYEDEDDFLEDSDEFDAVDEDIEDNEEVEEEMEDGDELRSRKEDGSQPGEAGEEEREALRPVGPPAVGVHDSSVLARACAALASD